MNRCLIGDSLSVLTTLPDGEIDCCVTSPPYFGLRDYGVDGQIGLEKTPEDYIEKLVIVFREVKRVLKDCGTLWLNIGDSYYNYRPGGHERKQTIARTDQDNPIAPSKRTNRYAGIKEKDLIGIPWMLAFALRADGWFLRQDIIWNKPNPMPESVKDRCTKSHEYIFLLSKNEKYYFNNEAISEPFNSNPTKPRDKRNEKYGAAFLTPLGKGLRSGYENGKRNKRSVWTVTTKAYTGAHFATFPKELIQPCILAGCPVGGVVLDPFFGSGTTGQVSQSLGRNWIGIEINPEYEKLQKERTAQQSIFLAA